MCVTLMDVESSWKTEWQNKLFSYLVITSIVSCRNCDISCCILTTYFRLLLPPCDYSRNCYHVCITTNGWASAFTMQENRNAEGTKNTNLDSGHTSKTRQALTSSNFGLNLAGPPDDTECSRILWHSACHIGAGIHQQEDVLRWLDRRHPDGDVFWRLEQRRRETWSGTLTAVLNA